MTKAPKSSRQAPRPAADPRVVAVFQATPTGSLGLVARRTTSGIEVLATREFTGANFDASNWGGEHLAARSVVVLPSGSVIARAVQMPRAADDKLASALELNATTFVLGRTSAHRVATAVLPGERGPERLRTGLVIEWPEDQPAPPLPSGLVEGSGTSFAPEVAALAALTAAGDEPLVAIDAAHGAVTVAAPTSKGVLVRIVRAGLEEGGIDASEIARAVGEACVHAGVPTAEINSAIERTREAARRAIDGGFGCSDRALIDLSKLVRIPDGADRATWWRAHGVTAGAALAALGPSTALTRLLSQDPGARPDRTAAVLNRLAEPRTRTRLMIAAAVLIAFGPLAFQGTRYMILKWKLPDVEAYEAAERQDEQRRALYRMLARNSASMTKTMSDIAAASPEGIEIDFVGIAPSVKGQSITLRGRARAVGSKSGTDALLQMEDLMRTSGMFEGITRSSEPPNQAGSQEFSIGAVATHATEIARYPKERDPAITSWREIRYGPPPADTDWAAEGMTDPGAAGAGANPATRSATLASETGSREHDEGDAGATAPAPAPPAADAGTGRRTSTSRTGTSQRTATATRTGESTTVAAAGAAPAGEVPAASGAAVPATAGATPPAAAGATPPPPPPPPGTTPPASETTAGAGETPRGGRPAPGTSGAGGLARRGTALGGSSSEPEPAPAALTEAEINAMTKAEAHERLATVAKARNRADLDDEVKARLRKEFDLLLERCKRD